MTDSGALPPGSTQSRGRLRRRIVAAIVAAIITVAFAATKAPPVVADTVSGVKLIGRLALPKDADPEESPIILQVNTEHNKLVTLYRNRKTQTEHLLEYDLRPRLPKINRDGDLGAGFVRNLPSPYLNVIDTKRDRLLMLHYPNFIGSSITPIDLKTLRRQTAWDLWERLPGFEGWGITYSEKDDLIYVIGETSASYSAQNGFSFPAGTKPPISAVLMALRPDTGSMAWALPLPHCHPLNTWSIGTLVARSSYYDAVYVPCSRNLAYPNMGGIERIYVDPQATQAEAMNFRQEFFPISGVWIQNGTVRGIAAFDPPTDRLIVQSLSLSTPGGWVFDGRISGWVGFVPNSEGPSDSIGVNEGTGHFYAGASNLPILVASIRGTPVPQGEVFRDVLIGSSGTFIYADPLSNRLFFGIPSSKNATTFTIAAFEDNTLDEVPLPPSNYDALTSDLEEGPNTTATFAGGVRGFGARIAAVGGGGGVWESLRQMLGGIQFPGWPVPSTSPGDRALVLASVPSIDLRNPGAAASAQGVAPDTNTDDETRTRARQVMEVCIAIQSSLVANGQRDLAEQLKTGCATTPTSSDSTKHNHQTLATACASIPKALEQKSQPTLAAAIAETCESVGIDAALTTVSKRIVWPWTPLACLDGGSAEVDQQTAGPGGQGDARINCDLEGEQASATTNGPGITMKLPAGTLSIGDTSTTARALRTGKGVITEITSIMKGLEVSVPGTGTLSIGEATSVAYAIAHGRPGTADVTLDRMLRRVVLRDGTGKIIRQIAECDVDAASCKTMLDAANSLLAARVRLYVPAAAARKTDKGAFAGVEKADAEYLNALNTQNDNTRIVPAIELIVYNDTAEKSRLVVQAAGVQVNSIYYLTANDTGSGEPEIIKEIVQVPVDRIVNVEVPGGTRTVTRIVQRPGGIPARFGSALAVMTRSPKEALHLALIWVLMGGAVASILRRRALRRSMES